MARQSVAPVQFTRSKRVDTSILMTSGRAGQVVPCGYFPVLMGDACAGRVGVDIQLAEMPRPLLNGVTANIQAWFVPKSAFPQFSGRDELLHAFTGKAIKALASVDRTPPPFFTTISGAALTTAAASVFFKTLGLHIPAGQSINSDLIDAFSLIYNFRLASYSSRLPLRKYASEDIAAATSLPPAFWPSVRFASVVPDYERALVVGSLDLDVIAGRLPVSGIGFYGTSGPAVGATDIRSSAKPAGEGAAATSYPVSWGTANLAVKTAGAIGAPSAAIFAELAGQSLSVSLSDIDKARTTQAFAKLRSAYAGNDNTGFDNDDTIVAILMQGISVPADEFKRPWLLDSKRVAVGFAERFATDGASLNNSVTLGRASATLSVNIPQQDVGGIVIFTVEVLPERLEERMSDEWLTTTTPAKLPNALRDIQRVEPVDLVLNRRVDAKHSTPDALYGYEPMNNVWNRSFTRLGGAFYQATPGAAYSQQRSAIWQTDPVNPVFSSAHFLAPVNFPHTVFSDTVAPAFEVVCRHVVTVLGLTQIGDVLAENNDDYNAVVGA